LKLLGTGSFGRVLLVRYSGNNNLYAMKILSKTQIKLKKQEEHTKTERDLMVKVNCPFVVNIKFAFQDESKLYIVSDFMQGGDMFYHLHTDRRKFPEDWAKFYLIELVLGLEFLHKHNVIYRDLKPENILMDLEGHLKISDFGLSKILDKPDDKAFTLCGTPQYISPEILSKKGYDKTVDWWSLGCFFYEMITGCLPFAIPKGNQIYGEIDAQKIKDHPYFNGVDWDKYWKKEIEPPFVPEIDGEMDLKYFDKMFTDEPLDSNRPTVMTRSRGPSEYKGFTYVTHSVTNELNDLGKKNNMDEAQIKEENDDNKV
jgi:serine/threonine protein kinase